MLASIGNRAQWLLWNCCSTVRQREVPAAARTRRRGRALQRAEATLSKYKFKNRFRSHCDKDKIEVIDGYTFMPREEAIVFH
jgi:hypothetical protein